MRSKEDIKCFYNSKDGNGHVVDFADGKREFWCAGYIPEWLDVDEYKDLARCAPKFHQTYELRAAGVAFNYTAQDPDGILNLIDGKRYFSTAEIERANYAKGYEPVGNDINYLMEKMPAKYKAELEAEGKQGRREAIERALAQVSN